ncbi:MAG: Ras family protein [Candidatus Paraimprobicoccus trichonymphae]|uniref:Ras family protein n=1 Tax=Candidatus Paraimprobicoccus trichonymphae TaxID=3033793 RepID=A0AA48KXI1_9FIRM|nr:MAG: Ras family protein [Candidatus Paraimprobicoccus trichonymphae]
MKFKKLIVFVFAFFCLFAQVSALRYLKVVIVGNFSDGKTGIWSRMKNENFNAHTGMSDDFRYFQKGLGNTDVNMKVHDTPGMEKYYSEVVDFLQRANYVFIVHDLSTEYYDYSGNYITEIYDDASCEIAPDGKIVFVGSKSDQRNLSSSKYTQNFGFLRDFLESMDCEFIITSSKDNVGKYIIMMME